MTNENTVVIRMEDFDKAYRRFMMDYGIHRSAKHITPTAFESYLGLVHIADWRKEAVFREYRITNKERFDYGKLKFSLF
jgi:hypothetical protein